MTVSGFSQIGYPKEVVWQGDTVVAITRSQMDFINSIKIAGDEYRTKYRYVKSMLDSCVKAIPIIQDEIGTFRQQVVLLNGAVSIRDKTITDMKTSLDYDTRYIKKLKREKAFIGTGATAVILFMGYLLVK